MNRAFAIAALGLCLAGPAVAAGDVPDPFALGFADLLGTEGHPVLDLVAGWPSAYLTWTGAAAAAESGFLVAGPAVLAPDAMHEGQVYAVTPKGMEPPEAILEALDLKLEDAVMAAVPLAAECPTESARPCTTLEPPRLIEAAARLLVPPVAMGTRASDGERLFDDTGMLALCAFGTPHAVAFFATPGGKPGTGAFVVVSKSCPNAYLGWVGDEHVTLDLKPHLINAKVAEALGALK